MGKGTDLFVMDNKMMDHVNCALASADHFSCSQQLLYAAAQIVLASCADTSVLYKTDTLQGQFEK